MQTVMNNEPAKPTFSMGATASTLGTTTNCFSAASLASLEIKDAPPMDRMWGTPYLVPLGTVRVQKIEFVNDIANAPDPELPGMATGAGPERSYHVTFGVEPPADTKTGAGRLPPFEATCLVAKNEVENQWVFSRCQ